MELMEHYETVDSVNTKVIHGTRITLKISFHAYIQ